MTNIDIRGDTTGDRWLYGHIFRVGDLTIGNWELRLNADLVNPSDQSDIRQGNVIILWSENRAVKILVSVEPVNNAGRWVRNPDGSYILAVDGSRATTQGSVNSGEEIAPMGDSGTNNVHLHLGLNYPKDNPLYYLEHTAAPYTVEFSSPSPGHIFTKSEIGEITDNSHPQYPFAAVVNSIGSLDLDKVDFWVYEGTGTRQYKLGHPYRPNFVYGGVPGEDKSEEVQATTPMLHMAHVEPMKINGENLPGRDKFVLWAEVPQYEEGTHQFVVKAYSVNYNTYTFSSNFIIDRTSPSFTIYDETKLGVIYDGEVTSSDKISIKADDNIMLERITVMTGSGAETIFEITDIPGTQKEKQAVFISI